MIKSREEHPLVVFVVAHPDDESMFFVPTIFGLQQQRRRQPPKGVKKPPPVLWLLCLTTGDYDGLGRIRSKELCRTGKDVLGLDNILLCNDDKIQDHPRQAWDIGYAAKLMETTLSKALQEECTTFTSIQIITFDKLGVSGHWNHRDTYLACRYLCWSRQTSKSGNDDNDVLPPLELWSLVSDTTPIFKYIPLLAWIHLVLTWCGILPRSSCVAVQEDPNQGRILLQQSFRLQYPLLNWRAMASHASQFVWYRRLFVVFSSYTYINRLERQTPSKA